MNGDYIREIQTFGIYSQSIGAWSIANVYEVVRHLTLSDTHK